MLDVQSPVPMTEGETIVAGIRTSHLIHFAIGFAVSTPVTAFAIIVLPYFGLPAWLALVAAAAIGLGFVVTPVRGMPAAQVLWLSVRYQQRPKLWLYDRDHRIRHWRKRAQMR